MKKKILSAAVVAAALLTGYSAYDAQRSLGMDDTLLANVEALANNTGEVTVIGRCYLAILAPVNERWAFFCNTNTDDSHIYPCPQFKIKYGFDIRKIGSCTK